MQRKAIAGIARAPLLRIAGFGYLYWLAFLLALDPDLLFGTAHGWLPAVRSDAARILAASSVGALMAAVQFVLVDRFPVSGRNRLSHLALHAAACLGLSLGAILVANAGVPLVVPADSPRLGRPLGEDISSNLLLLSFALGAFAALLHVPRLAKTAEPAPVLQREPRIPVQTRNGVIFIETASIDWIEAQGNYAALHVGEAEHLVRETLTRLTGRLDPGLFVRIHRGAIVNVERLKRVKPLSSGDALVELGDGRELRASRTFAGALRKRLSPGQG